ncbi:MAG: hypothetical protein MJE66_08215, partial [Proteobacteria bacterium]|nr:hypothetical protein [Pseudomonadota bacterium]
LDGSVGPVSVRAGKQQVVWGKADGLKVLDVVNPQSFREFILDDFEDSRIPLWLLNAEWAVGDVLLQLLWIPDKTYHELPEARALWAFTAPRFRPTPPPGVGLVLEDPERPSRFFEDSDAGARLSAFVGGFDLTLNYLYLYDDIPVPFRRLELTPMGPRVVVTPGYERTHLVGGTFSTAVGDLTVRGEFGYQTDRFAPTERVSDSDGVVRTEEFQYVLGFDWFGLSETLLSLQFFQSILKDRPSGVLRPRLEENLTFLARREFLNDRGELELLLIQGLDEGDGAARARVSFEVTDHWSVYVRGDVLYGDRDGVFGQFDANDRVVFGFEWSRQWL